MRGAIKQFLARTSFVRLITVVETTVSKILILLLLIVLVWALVSLGTRVFQDVTDAPLSLPKKELNNLFGGFLDILIALEILENVVAYLRRHVIHVELVISTALIGVARKILLLDDDKLKNYDLIGLGIIVIALALGYWLVRHSHRKHRNAA